MAERTAGTIFPCEFHVAGNIRKKYGFEKSLFGSSGNAVFADFPAVREFARKMNALRAPGEKPVRAGDLNAMGLIDEFMHLVFRTYESSHHPGFLGRAIRRLEASIGAGRFRSTLTSFTELFPPAAVHAGEKNVAEYLSGTTGGRPHPEVALEEILMLHLANLNPAFTPFRELFDPGELSVASSYENLVTGVRSLLREAPVKGGTGGGVSILDILEAPMKAHPNSLSAQMRFISERWVEYLPEGFRRSILSAEDLAREDNKQYQTGGAGPITLPDYAASGRGNPVGYPETENFTHDSEWMPNVVLLAKNTYVWLHQLSKRHRRNISRLDEVPDEELDRIAGWNFTSLWLIGVWSRSPASEKIKKMSGNPEAAPSAYSIFEYEIAPDLGGEEAFSNLSHRAWQRGIRMAADMVPNHTGLTSRWMKEHPDYFIQSDQAPFPAYRFTGENLSDDADYQVRIEDGYWSKTDASVVFQRIDNRNGQTRYIYHGNDGTNMPWNDTAQLDFLKAGVREAVIGQIMHVARKFSILRFDAAMTLAKKHFHRLWYPQPGTGGDIPSRSDHGMWQEDFDAVFPAEFWREVVDRINAEMPQTLLLAEAFWLLEGYFVRTLGMHRVYNSAFMHILMKEDNAKYREAIRSTLHFDPEILKRYVNFMSNPDEKTAVDQFGRGDKYFGIATLMVTLPGLPMFAHGQVEGFGEKYGMEYRRDYRDEIPDAELVRRHESDIFPLLKLRHLFSQTADFELYDVVDGSGRVIEDIFAYSNMAGDERAIVAYNNRNESYSGRIRISAGKLPASGGGGIRVQSLGEALRMNGSADVYYIFREQRSGLEFIRPGREFTNDGMAVELAAFQSQVFLNFREVRDIDGLRGRLFMELEGRGVRDIEKAIRALALRPFHDALAQLLEPALVASVSGKPAALKEFKLRFAAASHALNENSPIPAVVLKQRGARMTLWLGKLSKSLSESSAHDSLDRDLLLGWLTVSALIGVGEIPDTRDDTRFRDLVLDLALECVYAKPSPGDGVARRKALLVECLVASGAAFVNDQNPRVSLRKIFEGRATREYIGVNDYEGVEYFNRESLTEIAAYWLLQMKFAGSAGILHQIVEQLIDAAASGGYQLGKLTAYLDSREFITLPMAPAPRSPRSGGKSGAAKKRPIPKNKN